MRRSLFILFIVVLQGMASRSLSGQEASPPDRIVEAIASLRGSDLDLTLRLLGEAVDADPSLGSTTV